MPFNEAIQRLMERCGMTRAEAIRYLVSALANR